jgi:hypothetical protein
MMPRVSLIFSLALALFAGPSRSLAAAPEPPEQTDRADAPQDDLDQQASVLLVIIGEPSTFALSEGIARSLVPNAVSRPYQGERRLYEVRFSLLPGGRAGSAFGLLEARLVTSPIERPGPAEASKVLASAQQRLQQVLIEIHKANMEVFRGQVNRAAQRRDRARQMVERRTADVAAIQLEAAKTGQSLEPPDSQLFVAVRRDNLSLRAELAGLAARRTAILEHLAEVKHELDAAKAQQQPVLDELAKVVKLREDQLARTRSLFEKGLTPQAELMKLDIELAQARADLAERRRQIAQQAGSEQLSQLNQQLVDVQIEIAAATARLEKTAEALQELEVLACSPLAIDHQRAQRALQNALAEQEAAATALAEVMETLQTAPAPKVIAIGRDTKTE